MIASTLSTNAASTALLERDGALWSLHDFSARQGLLPAAIRLGVDPVGNLPDVEADDYDLLLTTARDCPAPWCHVANIDRELGRIIQYIEANPVASATLVDVLRLNENHTFEQGLQLESMAYSMLLSGREFRCWRERTPVQTARRANNNPVSFQRHDDRVTLTLSAPESHNALSASMRDALAEALDSLLIDPTKPRLLLRGAGRVFCTGGDVSEFGQATDPAEAHCIRTARSVARKLHQLGPSATVHVHGPSIGGGIEIAAACHRVICDPRSWFQLPEVTMGLIPGAGGTVSIAGRIGRHRAGFMALTASRLRPVTARQWGLVDAIEPVGREALVNDDTT